MNPLVNSTRITKNRKAFRKQNLSIINNLAANQHNCENVANYRVNNDIRMESWVYASLHPDSTKLIICPS